MLGIKEDRFLKSEWKIVNFDKSIRLI